MKYLSLFSGIGGFELGIQQAYELLYNAVGVEVKGDTDTPRDLPDDTGDVLQEGRQRPMCIGYSEIDKYACQVYSKHFPNHQNYGDITKIEAEKLPDFDLIVGGFPCQSFSIAGKRGGFNDTRGTLFFDIARIIRAKQPRLLLLENVKGLLSHDEGRTFRVIISTLDELGYDIQWQVLNSKNHGVPQNRERIFIIGHLRGTPRPEVFPIGESEAISDKERVAGSPSISALTATDYKGPSKQRPNLVVPVGTLRTHKDGQGFRELKEGISPTIPARAREDGSGQPVILVPEATKKGYAEARPGQSINLSVMGSKTRRGRVSDIAQTIDTGMQQYTLAPGMRIRRLTPTECERLQGFPDGWTDILSDTQRYKTLGNAVTVNVIKDIMIRLPLGVGKGIV